MKYFLKKIFGTKLSDKIYSGITFQQKQYKNASYQKAE